MEAKELVYKTLKDSSEALKSKQIIELSGLDKKDVDKAIKALKKEEVVTSPKNCFYAAK